MPIPCNQSQHYNENGYCELDISASPSDLSDVKNHIENRIRTNHPGNILDANNQPRALHGYEKSSGLITGLMDNLATIAKNFLAARQVYIYQFRINVKYPCPAESIGQGGWKPHRDFDYWQKLDGMDEPQVVIFHLLVTDHTLENGALEICPRSHKTELGADQLIIADEEDWQSGFNENIKYQIRGETFSAKDSIFLTGSAGSVFAMHPLIWHGSAPNGTREPRILLSMVFNDVENTVSNPNRPAFVVQPPELAMW